MNPAALVPAQPSGLCATCCLFTKSLKWGRQWGYSFVTAELCPSSSCSLELWRSWSKPQCIGPESSQNTHSAAAHPDRSFGCCPDTAVQGALLTCSHSSQELTSGWACGPLHSMGFQWGTGPCTEANHLLPATAALSSTPALVPID